MKHLSLMIIVFSFLVHCSAFGQSLEQSLTTAMDRLDSAIQQLDAQSPQANHELEEASAMLEALIEEHHIQSPALYQALGNAYVLQGDTGHSVLAYRRGNVLDPTNKELRSSLEYAQAAVSTQIDQSPKNKIWDLALIWRGYVARSLLAKLALILFTGGWIVLSLAVLKPAARLFFRAGIVLIIGSLIPASMLGLDWYAMHASPLGIVTQENTYAYSGPDDDIYPLVFETPLAPGVEILQISTDAGWSKVQLRDGSQCWVPRDHYDLLFQ